MPSQPLPSEILILGPFKGLFLDEASLRNALVQLTAELIPASHQVALTTS